MRTSPAGPATMAGNAWATPAGAVETSCFADHVSPPSVERANQIRSGASLVPAAPAFQSAYSVPASSEAMVAWAPRYAQPHRSAEQSGGEPEISSSLSDQVEPPSRDELTYSWTGPFACPFWV